MFHVCSTEPQPGKLNTIMVPNNHRIIEQLGLEGTLTPIQFHPLSRAGLPTTRKKKKEKKLAIIQNLETYRGLVSNKEGGGRRIHAVR